MKIKMSVKMSNASMAKYKRIDEKRSSNFFEKPNSKRLEITEGRMREKKELTREKRKNDEKEI